MQERLDHAAVEQYLNQLNQNQAGTSGWQFQQCIVMTPKTCNAMENWNCTWRFKLVKPHRDDSNVRMSTNLIFRLHFLFFKCVWMVDDFIWPGKFKTRWLSQRLYMQLDHWSGTMQMQARLVQGPGDSWWLHATNLPRRGAERCPVGPCILQSYVKRASWRFLNVGKHVSVFKDSHGTLWHSVFGKGLI